MAVSVPELARIVGCQGTHIRELITMGMPVYIRGGPGKSHVLSTGDCIKWLIEREKGIVKPQEQRKKPTEEGNRLAEIKIEKAELELAAQRGDLFHMDDWGPLVEEALVEARGRILRVADEFREEFPDTPQAGSISRWLKRQLTARLNGVANELFDTPDKASNQ